MVSIKLMLRQQTTTNKQMNHNSVSYKELAQLIQTCIASRLPLLILGSPGLGKTSVVRQEVERIGFGMMENLGYLYEPVDFRGLMMAGRDGMTECFPLNRWPLARMVKAGHIPERGVLLLDEMLNSHRDVLTAFAEPLCDHRVNGEPLAPGWSIIATGNGIGRGTSANPMPSHVSNRVAICNLVPSWDEWLTWAAGRIRPELIAYFTMTKGAELFSFDPAKIQQPNHPYLTPRSLENLSRAINSWDQTSGGQRPPLWLYSSVVGDFGAKLYTTLDVLTEVTPWSEIMNDPEKAKISDQEAVIYTQIQVILAELKSATSKTKVVPASVGRAVATYANRFRREILATAMVIWMRNCRPWADVPQVAEWFSQNQDLI